MMQVKVGYLVAYDYELLKYSLPAVYPVADKIVLAIDKNRLTFAGKPFAIDPSFFEWLREFDKEEKIDVYEEAVYQEGLLPSPTETRIRNLLAKRMGEGGWHVQLDVDEYFVDAEFFVSELRALEPVAAQRKITVMAHLSSIFKVADDGYFMITNPESFSIATNNPVYKYHRYNDAENRRCSVTSLLAHQSWGRTEDDLKTKLTNWGHRDDFDTQAYYKFWQSLNTDNYAYVKDFHPMRPELWSRLEFIKANSIEEMLTKMNSRIEKETNKERFTGLRKWLPPVVYHRLQKLA